MELFLHSIITNNCKLTAVNTSYTEIKIILNFTYVNRFHVIELSSINTASFCTSNVSWACNFKALNKIIYQAQTWAEAQSHLNV